MTRAKANATPCKINFDSYRPEPGRVHLYKNKAGLWAYVTRAELYAMYRHQPDPEGIPR